MVVDKVHHQTPLEMLHVMHDAEPECPIVGDNDSVGCG